MGVCVGSSNRFVTTSTQRYDGGPAFQKRTWSSIPGSCCCESSFTFANSTRVDAVSGGGGTRKSFPEEIAQVFQFPAFGSTGAEGPLWAPNGSRQRNPQSAWCTFISYPPD